jgi:hypothetical protein
VCLVLTSTAVLRVLARAGVNQLFPIFSSLPDALADATMNRGSLTSVLVMRDEQETIGADMAALTDVLPGPDGPCRC